MTEPLSDLSHALAAAVARIAPSVVRVKVHQRHVSSGIALAPDLVVTTHHDLGRGGGDVRLLLEDGREATGSIFGRDPATDLALVRVPGADLPVPTWHGTGDLAVGHLVLALGRPTRTIRALWGIVGGLDGPWESALGGRVDRYVDVDASLRWGFAGGPLVDARGRVVGVNSAALTRSGTTVPAETVQRVAERLQARGGGAGGYLGVGATPVALPAAIAEAVGQEQAALVVSVAEASPAHAAGLLLGDTLVAIDGHPTRTVAEVAGVLAGQAPGDTVTLAVLRAGEIIELSATLGARP